MHESKQIFLEPLLFNVFEIEALIESSPLMETEAQRAAAIIISTEIFCNIVEHAQIPEHSEVRFGLKRIEEGLEIEFVYETKNFDNLLKTAKEPSRYYKKEARRYRGLGLIMLQNLAKDIEYKKGDVKSSIIVIL